MHPPRVSLTVLPTVKLIPFQNISADQSFNLNVTCHNILTHDMSKCAKLGIGA